MALSFQGTSVIHFTVAVSLSNFPFAFLAVAATSAIAQLDITGPRFVRRSG